MSEKMRLEQSGSKVSGGVCSYVTRRDAIAIASCTQILLEVNVFLYLVSYLYLSF